MKVFVEGGARKGKDIRTACRKGFAGFLKKAGLGSRMPKVIPCGSRLDAYNDFCIAVKNNEDAVLLVDSETQVKPAHYGTINPVADGCHDKYNNDWKPWQHLAERQGDGWAKPDTATDEQCHLMVECMEAWLLADRHTLADFFKQHFRVSALPAASRPIESVSKQQLYTSLSDATRNCQKVYDKGDNSFILLELIDANVVLAASPWADRFVCYLKNKMA